MQSINPILVKNVWNFATRGERHVVCAISNSSRGQCQVAQQSNTVGVFLRAVGSHISDAMENDVLYPIEIPSRWHH